MPSKKDALLNRPILRVDTTMHTARILSLSTDSANRYLVSGAEDKTVRVWNAINLQHERTLRLPIGDADEGMVNAVAISPDGNLIACGGWTGKQWYGTFNIYVFDRSSGEIVRRLSGIKNVIFALRWSIDGKYLAVGLGGKGGIRVYRTSDYSTVFIDNGYENSCYSVDFSADGYLVASSVDGKIHLYNSYFKKSGEISTGHGMVPYDVRFSPDGNRIAVGHMNAKAVKIFSKERGLDVFNPYTEDITVGGDFHNIAWSEDGDHLYGGGICKNVKYIVRKWYLNRGKMFKDFPVSENVITGILSMKDGRIIFCTAEPSIGVIDNLEITKATVASSAICDFKGMGNDFLVSHDGDTIQYNYMFGGRASNIFSVKNRHIKNDNLSFMRRNMSSPIVFSNDLRVDDWKNKNKFLLNNDLIEFDSLEISCCLAFSPDDSFFLLGTSWFLRRYNNKGGIDWKFQGTVLGVNISGDGKIVVAAFSDGIIRWIRAQDGKEVLAFFPHKDRMHWILMTINGFYDCYPGADELIGWHLNNGTECSADFFPVSRFKSAYYRPKVINNILDCLDEDKALKKVSRITGEKTSKVDITALLPPVIKILTPRDGSAYSSDNIVIKFIVRTPSGKSIISINIIVNGRTILTIIDKDKMPRDGEVHEVDIPVKENEVEIQLYANDGKLKSDTSNIYLFKKIEPHTDKSVELKDIQLKSDLLLMTVNFLNHKYSVSNDYKERNSSNIGDVLYIGTREMFNTISRINLYGQHATLDEISNIIGKNNFEDRENGLIIIYISGFMKIGKDGIYQLLANYNSDGEILSYEDYSNVRNIIYDIPGKVVLINDLYFKKEGSDNGNGEFNSEKFIELFSNPPYGKVVYSCLHSDIKELTEKEESYNSFHDSLIEGLNGKADYFGDGTISVNSLDIYLSEIFDKCDEKGLYFNVSSSSDMCNYKFLRCRKGKE